MPAARLRPCPTCPPPAEAGPGTRARRGGRDRLPLQHRSRQHATTPVRFRVWSSVARFRVWSSKPNSISSLEFWRCRRRRISGVGRRSPLTRSARAAGGRATRPRRLEGGRDGPDASGRNVTPPSPAAATAAAAAAAAAAGMHAQSLQGGPRDDGLRACLLSLPPPPPPPRPPPPPPAVYLPFDALQLCACVYVDAAHGSVAVAFMS